MGPGPPMGPPPQVALGLLGGRKFDGGCGPQLFMGPPPPPPPQEEETGRPGPMPQGPGVLEPPELFEGLGTKPPEPGPQGTSGGGGTGPPPGVGGPGDGPW